MPGKINSSKVDVVDPAKGTRKSLELDRQQAFHELFEPDCSINYA